jgi:solute:Na+ symporter, SSS family
MVSADRLSVDFSNSGLLLLNDALSMSNIDWLVLFLTIAFIVVYGVYKSRGQRNIQSFLLADQQLPWYHVSLSVMATQASAITFLSAPGLAYADGMRFVQFYFGLPLAMIVLSITFIPIYHRLKVYTAYEFLEQRFDVKTRSLTAFLFLIQRGLSTGITIYAPSLVLSHVLEMDIRYAIFFIGILVIFYTVYGGTKAVSYTQMLQMAIIFSGLFIAASMVVALLPERVGFSKALKVAGAMDRMNILDFKWDLSNKYNIWSGLIGGFFLQLSYFGTDQSQVGRYLTGSSVSESRLGLIMNGLIKIPMQFFILMIGVLVFAYYQFNAPPVYFNKAEIANVAQSGNAAAFRQAEAAYLDAYQERIKGVEILSDALDGQDQEAIIAAKDQYRQLAAKTETHRQEAIAQITAASNTADKNDSNYVFLTFVTQHLPMGLVGLLIAIIFLASMGSTASGLNSLASTTVVDIYKRWISKSGSDRQYLVASRLSTFFWGLFCIFIALNAAKLGNLIEAVNILGSLFYGTILGVFLVAFYMKKINGHQVFVAAVVAEGVVVYSYYMEWVEYLWLNVIGCLAVMAVSEILYQTGLLKGASKKEWEG